MNYCDPSALETKIQDVTTLNFKVLRSIHLRQPKPKDVISHMKGWTTVS